MNIMYFCNAILLLISSASQSDGMCNTNDARASIGYELTSGDSQIENEKPKQIIKIMEPINLFIIITHRHHHLMRSLLPQTLRKVECQHQSATEKLNDFHVFEVVIFNIYECDERRRSTSA